MTWQSSNVEQAPHVPATQDCPVGQSIGKSHAPPDGEQTPDAQDSPEAQSVSAEQVHCTPVCVAVQVADGPHWLFAVHVVHWLFTQASPVLHWLFVLQLVQPLRHCEQDRIGEHMPLRQ